MAINTLKRQPRSGWLRFDIAEEFINLEHPDTDKTTNLWSIRTAPVLESVLEHCIEAAELSVTVFIKDPHLHWIHEIIKFHDCAEAVITDFTPHDPITKAEKRQLELLGLDVLSTARNHGDLVAKHIHNCVRIFEAECTDFEALKSDILHEISQQQVAGKIKPYQEKTVEFFETLYSYAAPDFDLLVTQIHDIDALHLVLRGSRIILNGHSRLPYGDDLEKMAEFWTFVEKKLRTPEAQNFYEYMKYLYDNDRDIDYAKALKVATRAYYDEMGLLHPSPGQNNNLNAKPQL